MIVCKIVNFTDNETRIVRTAELVAEGQDPVEAFNRAAEKARAANVRAMNYQIPKEYLDAEGVTLTLVDAEVILGEFLQNIPVELTRCAQCGSYSGACWHYGGKAEADPDTYCTGCSNIHGTGEKTLKYAGNVIVTYPFMTKLSPMEVVDFLKETTYPEFAPLKKELLNFLQSPDDYIDDIDDEEFVLDTSQWSFGCDE